jgi:hypothetical protein
MKKGMEQVATQWLPVRSQVRPVQYFMSANDLHSTDDPYRVRFTSFLFRTHTVFIVVRQICKVYR